MTDVTIRGAGIFGLSIAWACVQRGAAVRVIDPYGAGAGSSGGVVGALAPHVPENWNAKKGYQLESLLMAQAFWRGVADAGGEDPGYIRSGRLQPVSDPAARTLALQRQNSAKELWQQHAVWEVHPMTESAKWQPDSPDEHLIFDSLSAHLHPRRACLALVAALSRHGVTVETDAPDHGAVVWATGVAGLDALSARHSRSMGNGVKGQAALLQYDAAGAPQIFAGGVHIIPHLDGTVAVGSTSERLFDDPSTTDEQLEAVVSAARTAVPALRDAPVVARWAGVRPRARSRAPMLGNWPQRDGHYVANGGFKIGFGMAPKIAQDMANLVLDGVDAIPEGFRVEDNL